jgi:hypothetical protein
VYLSHYNGLIHVEAAEAPRLLKRPAHLEEGRTEASTLHTVTDIDNISRPYNAIRLVQHKTDPEPRRCSWVIERMGNSARSIPQER